MEDNDIVLTEEQKTKIIEIWKANPKAPPFLKDISKVIFNKEVDGRSKEGKAIKEFLALQNFVPKVTQDYIPKDEIVLTDEQKEFAVNNAGTMNALEIAKTLFNNNNLTNLNKETRTINEYLKTIDKKALYADTDEVPSDVVYKAPRTFERMLFKINKYIHEGIDKDKITHRQRKEVNAIIGYMNTYRFGHQINTYTNQTDRELFESSFVRYTHDKCDLTQEEVDQYIVLATEVVISSSIQAAIIRLQDLLDEQTGNPDNVKISMSLVEAINTARTEYNQCVNRQQKLLNDLKEKRSDRLKNQIKENASILNLVQMWKDEDSRQKLIKLANLRKQVLTDEVQRLTTMDEVKCRILGISQEEVLNG
jgi:hypothetical protein